MQILSAFEAYHDTTRRSRPDDPPGRQGDATCGAPLPRNARRRFGRALPISAVVVAFLLPATTTRGQLPDPLALPAGGPEPALRVTADLIADVSAIEPGKPFTLGVRLNVPPGTYVYYRTGGSFGLPTKVEFSGPPGFAIGSARFPVPTVKYETLGDTTSAHYVYKKTRVVLAEVTPPADLTPPATVELKAQVSFQYCLEGGACFPPTPQDLVRRLPVAKGSTEPSPAAAEIASSRRSLPVAGDQGQHAKVRAVFSQDKLRPGDKAELAIIVEVEKGYHIQMNRPPVDALISTDAIVHEVPGVKLGAPVYPEGDQLEDPPAGFEKVRELRGRVVIRVPVTAGDSLTGSSVVFSGLVLYQACKDKGVCFQPTSGAFELAVPVATNGVPVTATNRAVFAARTAAVSANLPAGNRPTVGPGDPKPAELGFLDNLQLSESDAGQRSLATYMLWAFLGGLILNVMPCVLPVIAIKILSFVQQAGESRGKILLLNFAYAAGVIAVFLALATLAVVAHVGWGGLFQKPEFNLVMAGLVFSMGLSLLGVFEIPVPGMIGSGGGPAQQEGPLGAFLTGVLATLLATPCSGPFLGITLGWSVRQPVSVTFLVWATMGLGMATPYLLLGAFPAAIRWLPRPGNWMVRFKEFAGIVLMGTVVFIITFLDETYTLPCLVMLVGLALGFWMIGNLYDINSHIEHKLLVRLSAVAFTTGICIFAFTFMKDVAEYRRDRRLAQFRARIEAEIGKTASAPAVSHGNELSWQPFSDARLKQLLAEGKTVLVDFTADW